jgi:hypothetical protein
MKKGDTLLYGVLICWGYEGYQKNENDGTKTQRRQNVQAVLISQVSLNAQR